MRNLFKISEKRRLELIEILLFKDDWTNLEWLAAKLNTNSRTIREDINYLKIRSEDFTININHIGVKIEFVPQIGLKKFYGQFLRESVPFSLLEKIFFDETLTVEDLANQLFVSVSSTYRTIQQLNKILEKKYDAKIETNPCQIVGNEKKIRNLYYAYFKEAYSVLEWPFKTINEADFNQAFKMLFQCFPFDLSHLLDFAYFESIKIGIAVNKIRYSANHLLTDIPEEETEWYINQMISLVSAPQISQLVHPYGKAEPEKNRERFYQLYSPYLTKQTVFSKEMLLEQRKVNPQLDYAVKTFITDLASFATDLGISVNAEYTALALIGTSSIEADDPNNLFILFDRDFHFIREFRLLFPTVTEQLHKIVSSFRQNLGLDLEDKNINHSLYTLLTIWDNLFTQLNKIYYSLNVTIISDGHKSHGEFIADYINSQLTVNPEFTVYNNLTLTAEEVNKHDSDLIITNFKLPKGVVTPNIMVEHFPTKNNIRQIEDKVRTIFSARTDGTSD